MRLWITLLSDSLQRDKHGRHNQDTKKPQKIELDTVKETKHQQKNLDKGKKRGSRGGVRLKGSEARVGLVGED